MFNKRLKELRLNQQLTQQLLSKEIDINDRTIRRYESGEMQPTATTIIKIANYFGVSADYLLGLSDDPKRK